MAQRKGSIQFSANVQHSQLRVAGLFLRRKAGQEFHTYISVLNYNPDHYEVLLRRWPSEPFLLHLGAFSGPAIAGEDPQVTLLRESQAWSINLANKAGADNANGLEGRRAVFLSVQGGGTQLDPVNNKSLHLGVFMTYVVPVKHSDSSVVSKYPISPEYPKFYNLGSILKNMVDGVVKIHPYTKEMLSSLDHWLREQHALPGAINSLFAPSLLSRVKMYVNNPLFSQSEENSVRETPNQSFLSNPHPLLSSTPFHRLIEDSTLHETTAFTIAKLNETSTSLQDYPVDVIVKNPLFGSELALEKANHTVVNEHFGKGVPDYDAVSKRKGKWVIQVQGDGLPDWTDLYPLHKFACAGDEEGVRRCIRLGMSPDERDSDTWSPLHYSCWYGELGIVKVLVEDASATIGIQNNSGSTPLHLAAATGHKDVVAYLLEQKGIGRLKAALDNDGKSPLAVCLECKMNDWNETSQLLREAYKNNTSDGLPLSPTLLSFSSQPSPSVEDLLLEGSHPKAVKKNNNMHEDLGHRGSLRNIDETDGEEPQKKADKRVQTVKRQRVNFMNGQHRVAHFFNGRETPARDVIQDLYRLMKLDKEYHSLFALWIVSNNLEIQLGDTDKPLKLMSTWKKFVGQYQGATPSKGKNHGDQEPPTFYLRRNVFFPIEREKTVSDSTALEFLYADVQCHVLSGYYPCSEEDALYLAGVSMQIAYGDYNTIVHKAGFLKDKLHQFLPGHMISSKRRVEFERRVQAKHAETTNLNIGDTKLLHVAYLKHCRQWKFYGAVFYEGTLQTKGARLMYHGKLSRKSELPFGVGINTTGFHFVNRDTNTFLDTLPLDSLEWDVSKNQMLLYRKDRSVNLLIHTKKAALIYSLITRMVEQYTGVGTEGSRTSITNS